MYKKWFNKRDKINFYLVNKYLQYIYIYINQYLTKKKQLDNETWSVNITRQKEYFSLKFMQKMNQGDHFQASSCFVKNLYMR